MTESDDEQQPPWWHSEPQSEQMDSVLVEGMKLLSVLKDWAVDSGAAATVAELTGSAASSASAYLSQVAASPADEQAEQVQQVVRCPDCPVCQGLDALDRGNPQLAQTARAALMQVSGLLAGFLPPPAEDGQENA